MIYIAITIGVLHFGNVKIYNYSFFYLLISWKR